MKTLRALAALLSYPTDDLVAAADDIRQVIDADVFLPPMERASLHRLVDALAGGDLYDLQERYGLLFDRTRALSLHLFEHVHGESRDRGQAMVDLLRLYEESGYTPTTSELPDFLPLFLEFASTRPPQVAIDLLGQPANVIAALKERLDKRSSPYAAVMSALLAMSRARLDEAALVTLRAEPDPEPDDLAALDAAWEEEEVTFGPGDGGSRDACGVEGLATRLRAAMRPADGVAPPLRPRKSVEGVAP
jgi:nitrate reductase delta subunit